MTFIEFLKQLQAMQLDWNHAYHPSRSLRCINGDCPIVALARHKQVGNRYRNIGALRLGVALGLSDFDTNAIIFMSDNLRPDNLSDARIWDNLRKACEKAA